MVDLTKNAVWRITYKDGTQVWEKDPKTGKETLFSDIDQDKVKVVDILTPVTKPEDLVNEEVKTVTENSWGEKVELSFKTYNKERILFHLELNDTQRLVLFRRNLKHNGQKTLVFGDRKLLDREYRKEVEEDLNKNKKPNEKREKVNAPPTIKYPYERPHEVIFLVGWQDTIGGKNVKAICFIYPDGHVELRNDR